MKNNVNQEVSQIYAIFLEVWIKRGPHTKLDKLRRVLHGGLTNSETKVTT